MLKSWSGKRAQVVTTELRDRLVVTSYPTDRSEPSLVQTIDFPPVPERATDGMHYYVGGDSYRLARQACYEQAERVLWQMANEYRLGRQISYESMLRRRQIVRARNTIKLANHAIAHCNESSEWYLDNLEVWATDWLIATEQLATLIG